MSIEATLVGKIIKDDPELRFTPAGKAVCNFTVVTDRRRKDATGKWESVDPMFWRVTVWDTLAENVAEHLHRGDGVILKGQTSMREYDRSDGSKGSSLEITAFEGGPNYRWAVPGGGAERGNGGQAQAAPEAGDPWATGSKTGRAAADAAADPWATGGSEPPF
jgi:single-strand DNA-binding protein